VPSITDKVMEGTAEWQNRQLGRLHRPDPPTVIRFVDERRDRYAVTLLPRVLKIAAST
jgi:hypothetical protein